MPLALPQYFQFLSRISSIAPTSQAGSHHVQ
jgi:hypothetical protein